MRLIRITTNYPVYIQKFYQAHPHLAEQPYAVQYRVLMEDCFGWADFWTYAFGRLGYDVWEPVNNAEPQQKAWANENGILFNQQNWLLDITLAQTRHFRPDVLFVNDYNTFTREFLDHLRGQCPSLRLIIGWCGAPYGDPNVFKAYDLVLSNIVSLVEHFRENGHKSELMRHAFEPRILNKLKLNTPKTIPFSFVGSIVKIDKFHNEREKLLKELLKKTNLIIWSDVNAPPINEYRKLVQLQILHKKARQIKKLPGGAILLALMSHYKNYSDNSKIDLSSYIDLDIAEKVKPGLYGLSMYQAIRDSQITFNNHIDISSQYANNMRLYEATGSGTCLLTDWKGNLKDLFEPDVEVVTYRTIEEIAEKLIYLSAHEDERIRIAKAGQNRTLQEHTFDLRAIELNKLIKVMV